MTEGEIVSWFVFKPHGWGERFLVDYCAARVHDTFGVGFHQCSRRPKEEVAGYRWCGQHAGKVQERLLREK